MKHSSGNMAKKVRMKCDRVADRIGNRIALHVFIFFILALVKPAKADNGIRSGALLMKKYCAECHARDGNSTTDKAPRIAGFSAMLIFDTLDQFKHLDRPAVTISSQKNRKTNMQVIAKQLNEEETEAIAIYLSQQSFKPALNPPLTAEQKKLVPQGKQLHQDLCNDCHGNYGRSAIDDAPILSGQWRNYLVRQFDLISQQKRYITRRMKRKFAKLTHLDKQALIAFYTQ